ncbi:DNA polymerase III subunit gamma/tau [Guyparkeria hydrothermalis]|uniref:DNA polymerase III subunit gamma/tau n=1 Tax=Guyparkeria hydrothermalis TaxID=923 RepID=UPI00201FD4E5|nr:DNA polymerase III subunit gamma/tau [Guyparkeria hydrothermalis]MCL7750023.1 DNA polymerase III subunit gamma/tau [Guyparkeria hydrothermalis]
MSYLVLARKWRPRRFDDMVGQGHVLQALTNALDRDRLHHAYLFTGTRGVGKTTVARIFAKALNCEQGVSSQPCGECAACREIDSGRFVDLIEVDAASRTKVDDTRELLENVVYLPVKGRFKIYLIDEVHMFSQASFNALLKTLEEPPEHVKFLLATTDPQKLPVTVLSRCLQFNLRALPEAHIQTYLADILNREGLEADPEALRLVSDAAGGSMRDALSLVDQAIGFCDGRLETEAVADMLGVTDRRLLHGLLERLAAGDADGVFGLVDQALERSVDPARLLAELAEAVHQSALAQWLPTDVPTVNVDAVTLQLWYQIALSGRRDIGWAPSPRIGLEMTLLRMLAFEPGVEPGSGTKGASSTQGTDTRRPSSASAPAPATSSPTAMQPPGEVPTMVSDRPSAPYEAARAVNDPAAASAQSTQAPVKSMAGEGVADAPTPPPARAAGGRSITPENWFEIVGQLSMPARSLAERCHATNEDDTVVLVIDPGFRSMASKATQERLVAQLERLGVTQPVRFMVGETSAVSAPVPPTVHASANAEPTEPADSSPAHGQPDPAGQPQRNGHVGDDLGGQAGQPAPAPSGAMETPAEVRERNERAEAQARVTSLREHPAAQVLAERAGAQLIQESVRPLGGHGTVNER